MTIALSEPCLATEFCAFPGRLNTVFLDLDTLYLPRDCDAPHVVRPRILSWTGEYKDSLWIWLKSELARGGTASLWGGAQG